MRNRIFVNKDGRLLYDEKEEVLVFFFSIDGNNQIKRLKDCKVICELYLEVHGRDEEIETVIKVINAITIYFKTGNKKKAMNAVSDVYYYLIDKEDNYTIFEIRILKYLFFLADSVKTVIEIATDCITELDENFCYHKDYIRVKTAIQLNYLISLMDAKFFSEDYRVEEYDKIITSLVDDIILLNLESKLNNRHYIALATIYKGIFIRDKKIIYVGFILLESDDYATEKNAKELINVFKTKYDIVL